MGRRYLFLAAAVGEGATGLALLVAPAVVISLLLGVDSGAPEALVVARVAGGALLAIALACWAVRGDDDRPARRGVLAGFLVYDMVAATALAYAGATAGMAGIALWPAVAAHVVLGVWCLACLAGKTPNRG